ncbi:hypothetical protein HZH66_007251 [Vespula vulgaris]|uniref:Uncharacterized protein n=1 Tax=Vespula vulgaris TaxID=7454 RepID=A0A834K0H6_VESVU|nr:hypothetical protein HZH66_007251 [Vespula vulgaris]
MDVECSVNEPERSVRIKRFYLDGDKDGRTPLEISASCSRSTDYEDAGRRDRLEEHDWPSLCHWHKRIDAHMHVMGYQELAS